MTMSPEQTPPLDACDTTELELPPVTEPSTAELEQLRPSWEPEDGDFG
jgi:hypothetical protein